MGYGEMRNYYTVIGIPKVRRPFVISLHKVEWGQYKNENLGNKK